MKKLLFVAAAVMALTQLTGCGVVEDGNVGVRTTWNGHIEDQELNQGFYTALTSSVTKFTVKETSIDIKDLTPKAKDKLILKDLDVAVYYRAAPGKVAAFMKNRSGQSGKLEGESFYRPGYFLVEKLAKGAASSAVAEFDSQTLHGSREPLEARIRASLQEELDKSDPGTFIITRVNITSLLPDPSVEDSIRKNIKAQNDIDTAMKQVSVKEQEAQANEKLARTLTPAFLQHEYIQAISECAKRSGCTLIVGNVGNTMLNIPKQ